MNRTLLTVSAVLSTSSLLLVDSAIKGGVVLLLAAVIALLLRRDSAATRHLVWQVSIVGMLVVPVFSAVLPQWRILPAWAVISASTVPHFPDALSERVPDEAEGSNSVSSALTSSRPDLLPSDSHSVSSGSIDVESIGRAAVVVHQPDVEVRTVQPAVVPAEILSEPPLREWSALNVLPILWLIGFAVLIVRLMAARLMLWSGERRGRLVVVSQNSTLDERGRDPSDKAIVDAFKAACEQLSVSRPVRLLIHSEQAIPVVWGIIQLRLLLPANARYWSAEQLQSVLLHELAHIKRRDPIAQLLAQVACALHWFNPLVWFASWRLHVERERACDDLVLANGVPPSAYAEHLLDVATRLSAARWTQACGLAMARKSSLEGRLVAVLNKQSNRRSVSASVALLALLLGFGVALPVAMLGPADGVLAAEDSAATGEDSVAVDGEAAADDSSASDEEAAPDDKLRHAAKSEDAMPADTTAAVLLKRWQALEGRKTPISEASLARLRSAIDKWVNQPPVKADAAEVLALRDRHIDRAEHPTFEVAGWLSAIAAIDRGPLQFAINGETRIGEALSEERQATLKFGPVAENGLRAAWSRYPQRDTYVVGDVVTSAVVIQNATDKTVEFTCPYSVDSLVK